MVNEFVLSLFVFVTFSSGVLSQFTRPDEICPGDDVMFTCVVGNGATVAWSVDPGGTDGLCLYVTTLQNSDICGPDGRFNSSRTEGSDSAANSSLSVVSITEDLNGTMVECADATNITDIIGSKTICILENAKGVQVLSATISERDVGGGEECVASVEWSEAIVSCGGSVSRYVLTLTPPTSDCQSSGDCMVMDGSSVITTPGTQTQYSLTVTSQDYDITVRADTCGGSLTGDSSSVYNLNMKDLGCTFGDVDENSGVNDVPGEGLAVLVGAMCSLITLPRA
jgi:hypothetical protein